MLADVLRQLLLHAQPEEVCWLRMCYVDVACRRIGMLLYNGAVVAVSCTRPKSHVTQP
jgi:hypothetical protein